MAAPITTVGNLETLANQSSGPGTIKRITQAIKQASARTGVDFSYLLNKASQESGFNPNAQASSSSASGLFQFTSQTWLQMMKTYGGQFGFSQYASDITVDGSGVAHVNNQANKQAILALRNDPTVSAEMAGELDQQNFAALKSDVGGKIGPTELYLAHFLGASGASDFLMNLRSSPNAKAANILPDAAASNPSVFYDKSGAPRSLSQIYQQFAQKFDHAPQIPGATTQAIQVASNTVTPQPTAKSSNFTPRVMGGIRPTNSSLYETMVMAQMNMHAADMSALGMSAGNAGGIGDRHKNASLAALGTMA